MKNQIEKIYDEISSINLYHYKKYHELEDRITKLEKKIAFLERDGKMNTNGWD